MSNLFAKAKAVTAKPAAAKKTKQEIALSGIEQLAELDALMKSLDAAKKTLEGEVKAAGFGEFLNMETNIRPESFKGIDGLGSASVEMRKRSTMSALNEDELATLKRNGIEAFKQVTTTEMFGINPAYAANGALMDKVSKALEKIVPEDFFVLQEETFKMVVTDEMLDTAFKLKQGRSDCLAIMTTMALKPKLSADYDMSKLMDKVAGYLAADTTEISE